MKTIKKNWDDAKIASKIDDSLSNFDDGELFVEETFSENVTFDDNKVKSASFDNEKGFGLRGVTGDSVSFSGNYWYARNYSINLGGESIEHIVNVCKWISKLPDCPFQKLANSTLQIFATFAEFS